MVTWRTLGVATLVLLSAVAVSAGSSVVSTQAPEFSVESIETSATTRPGERIAITATIANTGDADGSTAVKFRFAGETLSSKQVSLAAGETKDITLTGKVPNLSAGTYTHGAFIGNTNQGKTATITVQRAEFSVTRLAAPASASPGDQVSVTATIANTGNIQGSTTVEYRINGEVIASRSVSADAGTTRSVSLSGPVPDLSGGTYDQGVFIGGTNRGRTVDLRIEQPRASFAISSLRAPSRASAGDSVSVTATVTNVGNAEGSTTVEYRIRSATLDSEKVTLEAGQSQTVTLSGVVPSLQPRTYTQGVFLKGTNRGQSTRLLVEGQASFRVSDLGAPSEADPGDRVTVAATVSNVGNAEGSTTIGYRIGGSEVATQQVTVAAGASRRVSFDVRVPALAAGSYTQGVFVGASTVGQTATLRIRGVAQFAVSDLRVPVSATVGDRLAVRATVTNTGTDRGSTRVEYRLGDRVLGSTSVTLAAGERDVVTFAPTVPNLAAGSYRTGVFLGDTDRGQSSAIAVRRPASSFSVSNLDAPSSARAGDRVTVLARVSNTGDGAGTTELQYRVGDRVVDAQRITLGAGESTTVRFEPTLPLLPAGEYTHGVFVGDATTGPTASIQVQEPAADFNVLNLRGPPRGGAGAEITVTATVLNAGTGPGETTVEYRLGGEVLASTDVSLGPGERTTVRFDVPIPDLPADTYAYGVFVADTNRGQTSSIVVERPPTPTTTTTTTTTTTATTTATTTTTTATRAFGTPGFGVGVAVAALAAAALLGARRYD